MQSLKLVPAIFLNQKVTRSLVTRLSCYKAPGELQVKIVENEAINIELVRLFLWK